MVDQNHIKSDEKDATIDKLLEALEAMAWLYNCKKLQMELRAIPSKYLER